jgi:hypothetical protein
MLSPLINSRKGLFGFSGMGFERDHVVEKIREFVLYFFSNYTKSTGKDRWADKSPTYVDHLSLILEIFPEAHFVMIHRHPLDQIHSHTQGGVILRDHLEEYHEEGDDYRVAAAKYWHEKTAMMLSFEQQHPDQCVRILYEDLATNPETTLKSVFAFLEEPWEREVLEFYKFDHHVGLENGQVKASQGFVLSSGHYKNWENEIKKRCLKIVSPNMGSLGYS